MQDKIAELNNEEERKISLFEKALFSSKVEL